MKTQKRFSALILATIMLFTALPISAIAYMSNETTETAAYVNEFKYTVTDGKARIGRYTGEGGVVTIPSIIDGYPVTSMDVTTFYCCDSLTCVIIPYGISNIAVGAFYGCSSLTSIVIPNSITIVDTRAFAACSSLTNVYYGGTQEQWNSIVFEDDNENLTNATINYNYIPADYTSVEEAVAKVPAELTKYTDVTAKAVTDAVNIVVYDLPEELQETVDAYAEAIEDAVAKLQIKAADYTAVEKALEKVPADLSVYTDETAQAVTDAVNAVVYGLTEDKQETVDAYAAAIEDAVSKLRYKAADYTAVEKALEKVPADLSKYTVESAQLVMDAVNAIVYGLTADKQTIVDGYAQAIEDALEELMEFVEPDQPVGRRESIFGIILDWNTVAGESYQNGNPTYRIEIKMFADGETKNYYTEDFVGFEVPQYGDFEPNRLVKMQLNSNGKIEVINSSLNIEYLTYGDLRFAVATEVLTETAMRFQEIELLENPVPEGWSTDAEGRPVYSEYAIDGKIYFRNLPIIAHISEETKFITVSKDPQDFDYYDGIDAKYFQKVVPSMVTDGGTIKLSDLDNGIYHIIAYTTFGIGEAKNEENDGSMENVIIFPRFFIDLRDKPADYTAVEKALAKVPTDLTVYTDETANAVTDAINAVVYGLTADKQRTVDGYAKAIEDALSNLKIKYVVNVGLGEKDDYVFGTKLVLVYTNADNVTFDYDGIQMFDVSGAGYKDNGTEYTHVYGLVVESLDENNAEAYEAKITVDYEEAATVIDYGKVNDVNGSDTVNWDDIISVYAVAENNADVFAHAMNIVIKADTNRDKVVDIRDATSIIAAVYGG